MSAPGPVGGRRVVLVGLRRPEAGGDRLHRGVAAIRIGTDILIGTDREHSGRAAAEAAAALERDEEDRA